MTKLYGTEKYQTVMKLMTAVIDLRSIDPITYNKAWDELFGFLHDNFVSPATTQHTTDKEAERNSNFEYEVNLVVGLMRSKEDEFKRLITSFPAELPEVVFPVAIGLYLTRYFPGAFMSSHSTTFKEFVRRYRLIIKRAAVIVEHQESSYSRISNS